MLALSADGSRAYVTNFWHGTVSVLDLRARRILAQIEIYFGTGDRRAGRPDVTCGRCARTR